MSLYKYVFLAGAPGSAWSRVAMSVYGSDSFDHSDSAEHRTHSFINDRNQLEKSFHHGAYFGPDQEFGKKFNDLRSLSLDEIENEFNAPFSGIGTKLIKCHDFSYQLDFISENWPDCPIIVCHRPTDVCYDWWLYVGGTEVKYPSYESLKTGDPIEYIGRCNTGIEAFIEKSKPKLVRDSMDMCEHLEIDFVKKVYLYHDVDVYVRV